MLKKFLAAIFALAFVFFPSTVNSQTPSIFGGLVPQSGASQAVFPGVLYALDSDNCLWFKSACSSRFKFLGRLALFLDDEILTGIDFRPSNGWLYGYSDRGRVYVINLNPLLAFRIASPQPSFPGGLQSLMDFNP